ncbi:MAG: hypothetical protein ABUL58_03845, partial [Steroidobacter sp.]
HYLPRDGKKHEFTFHDLSVKFHRYCFPFATQLQYSVSNLEARGNRHRFEVYVAVKQCEEVVMSAVANMTAHVSPLLSRIESEQATKSLDQHLASLSRTATSDLPQPARVDEEELAVMEA